MKSKLEGAVSLGIAKAKSLNVPAKTKDVSAKSKIKIKEYNIKARAAVAEQQKRVDLGPTKKLLSSFFTKLFIILFTLLLCWVAFIYQQDALVPFNTIEGLSYTIKRLFLNIHVLLNNPAVLGDTIARLLGTLIIPIGLGVLIAKGFRAKKPKYYGFLLGCYLIFPILLITMASNKASLDADKQGDSYAKLSQGSTLDNERTDSENEGAAVKTAAEQGDANAQFNLGLMHEIGQGVPMDKAEAVNWYRKAAEQGQDNAMYNLGYMYALGEDVTKNYIIAYQWISLSAAQGNSKARQVKELLEGEMTSTQIGEAQRISSECFANDYLDCN